MNEDREAEIVVRLQFNCPLAFQHLYDAYAPALYGTIQKMVKCPISAQDVLQKVFIKIWLSSDQYQAAKGRLFTWMITITRHETIVYLRSRYYRQLTLTDRGVQEDVVDRNVTGQQLIRFDIRKLIQQLPSKERSILDLALSGFTCREIGQLLKLPEGTVKTNMRTSYRKLRLALQN